jgi:hypothetical protein
MYHYYGAMEERFGKADRTSLPGKVWQQFPELPRQDKIKRDLQTVGAWSENLEMSPATQKCKYPPYLRSPSHPSFSAALPSHALSPYLMPRALLADVESIHIAADQDGGARSCEAE